MSRIVNKVCQNLKQLLNRKGQGIVEFALLLAFCVGIGFVARDSGILSAFTASFDQAVTAFLTDASDGTSTSSGNSGQQQGGNNNNNNNDNNDNNNDNNNNNNNNSGGGNGNNGGSSTNDGFAGVGAISGFDWGDKDPTKYYNSAYNESGNAFTKDDSQKDRLAADQNTLANLAKYFLGKTQNEVIGMLKGKNDGKDYTADMASNQEVLLGHIVPYDNGTKKGMRFKSDKGVLNAAEGQNIFAWMQGIYNTVSEGETDKYGAVINSNYNHDRMYLVSDYVVSQTWADTAGTFQENGIRVKFEYDYSGSYIYPDTYNENGAVKVVGVQLSIDPRSQNNSEVGTSQFNEQHSNGLEVHVRVVGKDENGNDKYSISYKDTGVTTTTSGNNGMTNWYGDDLLNKPSDWKKVCIASKNPENISNGGVFDFEKGDIIQYGSNYYIAIKEKRNLTIEKGWEQKHLEYKNSYQNGTLESQIFVKITGTVSNTGSYIVENAKVTFDDAKGCYPKKSITYRGWPVILGSGEVYLYVGDEQPTLYTGIDEENYIKLR